MPDTPQGIPGMAGIHRDFRLTPAGPVSAAEAGIPSQDDALTELQASNLAPAQTVAGVFFDDFLNPALACFYEIIPGIGTVSRRDGGLHYEITRAPDGPSDASDYLTIDSLGRPHSHTTRAVFRFSGTDWTLEACVEYDFPLMRNGRGAYLWLIPGDVSDGYQESIALIRYADLDPPTRPGRHHRLVRTLAHRHHRELGQRLPRREREPGRDLRSQRRSHTALTCHT